ncbi:MAG: hypothetical protein HYZ14_15170 [Bacteroidetes bacterium]|nr:hypothetical protein [Bacteroidota bacterium]
MKWQRKGMVALTIAMAGLTACNKETQQEEDNTAVAEDVVVSSRESEEIMPEELYSVTTCTYDWPEMIGDCAVVTESSVEFPKTVTIDFGDGCTGPNGRTKKGKIIIDISNDIRVEGTTRVLTFEDFWIDDVTVTGSRTATNIGLSTSGNILISETGTTVATRDGNSRTRTVNHQREWIQGSSTCEREDDEFLITGSGTITGACGEGTHTIIEPLYVTPGACNYILSGTIKVERGNHRGGTIDFGDGACDNTATLTTNHGDVFEINLDERKIMH